MPLFIPIAIGLGVAAALGYGGKKSYDGVGTFKRAKEVAEGAQEWHRKRVRLLESSRVHLGGTMDRLHELRAVVARDTIGGAVALLERLEQHARAREFGLSEEIGLTTGSLQTFRAQSVQGKELLRRAGTALGASAAAKAVTTSLVTSLGTASTGTAITGLSGAAANSAMLAWLGGGSLAAGGWGMAAGAVVLGGVAVAPAVALGGLVLSSQAAKALTEAETYAADVAEKVAQVDTLISVAHRAEVRVREMMVVTREVDERARPLLASLAERADAGSFDFESDVDVDDLRTLMQLAKALSDLNATVILDEDGKVPTATRVLIEAVKQGQVS